MLFRFLSGIFVVASLIGLQASASCEPNLAFLPPQYSRDDLSSTFQDVESALQEYLAAQAGSAFNFSMQVSSSSETLWELSNSTSGNEADIDSDTSFRIASMTKIFIGLGVMQLQAAGKVDLDRSVSDYVPMLRNSNNSLIDWDQISVESLLTHTSGLPDNYATLDLLTLGEASAFLLPPVSNETLSSLPACELNTNITCDLEGLLAWIVSVKPVFPPKTQASYSNVGYDLLGVLISQISGQSIEDYIRTAITEPLNMTSTTFDTPPPGECSIPPGPSAYGDDLGSDNASGGLWSTANDMNKLLQYILLNHNTIASAVSWFAPRTYSTGSRSLIGMPWEIYRTTSVLNQTNRPVTFITKGGGLTGYYSYSVLLPDYNLTLVLVTSGDVSVTTGLLDTITVPLVQGAEQFAQQNLADQYSGTFSAFSNAIAGDVSMTLEQSSERSLHIANFTINGTDVLSSMNAFASSLGGTGSNIYWQLTPTLQQRFSPALNATASVWRFVNVFDNSVNTSSPTSMWADYCVSNFDPVNYAGVPVLEMLFKMDAAGKATDVELSAWNSVITRM